MGRLAATGAAALGGVAMLVGGVTTSWWHGTLGLELGLRTMKVCMLGTCETEPVSSVLVGHEVFRAVATATWLACLLGGAALAAGAVLFWRRDQGAVLGPSRWGAVAAFCLAVVAVATFPGEDASIGWSFWLTVLGALGGFVGGTAALSPATAEPSTYVPVSMSTPRTPPTITRTPMGSTEMVRPERSGPVARGSTTGRLAIEDANLRFVVKQLQIREDGLEAEMVDGTSRSLSWGELGSLFVGQLPVDPPFEKRMFLDLVPRVGGTPLRLLPTTRANYDATGEAAATSVENFRRLAVHARTKAPGLAVDHLTRAFVQDRKAPRQFLALSQFSEYDSRYGS